MPEQTDLAPVLDMLNNCGFTRTNTTRAPTSWWYERLIGDGLQLSVTVYPHGNEVPRPATPGPCVRVAVHDPAAGWALRWRTEFRAGTPAAVITAALSAAMRDADGTQPARAG